MELILLFLVLLTTVYVLWSKKDIQIKSNLTCGVVFLILSRVVLIVLAVLFTGENFKNCFSGWDGQHYLFIAEHGYVSYGEGAEFIVFYPLYPLMIKIFSFVFRDYFLSGLIVSNTAMVIGVIYLYKLARLDLDEKGSLFATVLALTFPFSFFLSGIYTESLFLMLCVMCFYYMRKKKWWLMGLIGLFASMTRVQGCILVFPALYELIKSKSSKKYYLSIFIIPVGIFIYLLINKLTMGSFLAFTHYQKDIWHQQMTWFGDNIANHTKYIINKSDLTYQIMLPQILLFFAGLMLIWFSRKKITISYAVYAIPYIFMTFSPSWLLSGSRYMMTLFPIYIAAAALTKSKFRYIIVGVNTIFLFIYTALFMLGKQIM